MVFLYIILRQVGLINILFCSNPICSRLCSRKWLRVCVWAGMPTMSTRQHSESTCSCCRSDFLLTELSSGVFQSLGVVAEHRHKTHTVAKSGSQVSTFAKEWEKHLTSHECPLCVECSRPVRREFFCSGCRLWVWQVTTPQTGLVGSLGVKWFQSFLSGRPGTERQNRPNVAPNNWKEKIANESKWWNCFENELKYKMCVSRIC